MLCNFKPSRVELSIEKLEGCCACKYKILPASQLAILPDWSQTQQDLCFCILDNTIVLNFMTPDMVCDCVASFALEML